MAKPEHQRYGNLPIGIRIADNILPGLGSDEGWHRDQESRQTKALERIAKNHGERRVVQEVAIRESRLPEKQVYPLVSDYSTDRVIDGLSSVVESQHGTTWATEANTQAVRESAQMLHEGLSGVEQRVGDVVDAAYQIDGSVRKVNRSVQEVNRSVRETNRLTKEQTKILKTGFEGTSFAAQSPERLMTLGELKEEEVVGMCLKGEMKGDVADSFIVKLSRRKQLLIRQVAQPIDDFHAPQLNRITFLKEERIKLAAKQDPKLQSKIDAYAAEIIDLIKQIEEEKSYMGRILDEWNTPTREKVLRLNARHGHMDEFAKDELGETVREVRTNTYGLNQSMRDLLEITHGVSPYKKSPAELISLTNLSEEEAVAMALKGVLDRRTTDEYFSSFSDRKKEVIGQVLNFDPHFQDYLHETINELEGILKTTEDDSLREKTEQKIALLKNQIAEELEYLEKISVAIDQPLQVDSLKTLARHGHLDRFVQDELGENIREVRTDVFGLNQSARESLGLMDTMLEKQDEQISNQEITIGLQEETLQELKNIGAGIIEELSGISYQLEGVQGTLTDILKVTAWTSVRVLETLGEIKNSIDDQSKNWRSHRFNEQLNQLFPVILGEDFEIAIEDLSEAQKLDRSDPRSYFLKGVSYMYMDKTQDAETELKQANKYGKLMVHRGASQKDVDETLSLVNTYLSRLYFKLSQREEDSSNENIEKAIETAKVAYFKNRNISSGIDLARYYRIKGDFFETYQILEDLFRHFAESVTIMLNDEDFAPFQEQIKRNKWSELLAFGKSVRKNRN